MIAADVAISWNEPFDASDNLDTMMLGRVGMDDRKVMARLCQEAIEDKGFAKCKALAEQRIRAALKAGRMLNEIVVKTTDFPRE